jgi:hypothetical protein
MAGTGLAGRARAVLAANDRGGYTVPTAGLYPFQWNWDSAFVAMGFATFDPDRALRELESLASGQWADGMIPHIVFHQSSDSYFPGPEIWGTDHAPPTSGITQPPVFGMALKDVAEKALAAGLPDAEARIRALFRAVMRSHRWWRSARDPEDTGLVALLHNWESGSDNSPAWDDALARVPSATVTPIRRKDNMHVDASMRPSDLDYQRYIHLVDVYRGCGWRPAEQWRRAPFKVADVQSTAILARATEDLLTLADAFGEAGDRAFLEELRASLAAGLMRQWRPALGRFVNRDLIAGEDILAPTQAGFLPLIALDLDAGMTAAATGEITRQLSLQRVKALASTPADAPCFDERRYWRGPIWAVVNWLLIDGLRRNNAVAFAEAIRCGLLDAIETAGFAEYFDPLTGEGLGGAGFTWTAAAWLVLSGGMERAGRR